jgi:2-polyprenyl-6-hydroxyphenyl methylase/3-demethylubiquinone-9 3-methyltransferase
VLLDGSRFKGRLPCLFCRHARRPKTQAEWRDLCGRCRGLTDDELSILYWYQEKDGERVVVPPNMLRHSRDNSDARYAAAREVLSAKGMALGARLLDIGCGISAQADMFRDFHYVGADLDRARLRRARSTHPWAEYAVQDVTGMGWRTHGFEAVLCLEVIEHVPPVQRLALLRELFRVIRPGGLLVLSTPNGRVTAAKRILGRKCERSHERELTPAEVGALVEEAGGTLVRAGVVDNLILPAGRIAAGVVHLVAGRARSRRGLQRLASKAGYETLLYVASPLRAGSVSEPALTPGE